MVSNAQNFEDVILRRILQDIEVGFYVDVGAWHPVHDSVTAWFYENGWRGINVEPDPEYFAEIEKARPRDVNLACVVGSTNGTSLFTVVEGTGLSSGLAHVIDASGDDVPGQRRVLAIPQVTLDHVLSLAPDTGIDFLKIDVEGMEGEMLNATTFERCRPRVLVVEATRPNSQIPSHSEWEPDLLAKRYEFALFDGLNRFYVREEDAWRKAIFRAPPCVFDNFLAPTLAAQRSQAEAALAKSEEQRASAEARVEELVAQASKSETERQDAIGQLDRANAQIGELEKALARSDAERATFEQQRAGALERVAEAEARIEGLARAGLRESEAERQATAIEQLDRANAQIGEMEKAVTRSDAERAAFEQQQIAERQNATEQLDRANAQIGELEKALTRSDAERAAFEQQQIADLDLAATLEAELSKARAEAAAWEEARIWKPQPIPTHAFHSVRPLRALHRRWMLFNARQAAHQRRWPVAAHYFGSALADRGDTPLIWVEYGHALKEAGDLSEAVRAYRKVLLLMPDHYDIGDHLAFLLSTIRERDASPECVTPRRDTPPKSKSTGCRPWQTHPLRLRIQGDPR